MRDHLHCLLKTQGGEHLWEAGWGGKTVGLGSDGSGTPAPCPLAEGAGTSPCTLGALVSCLSVTAGHSVRVTLWPV